MPLSCSSRARQSGVGGSKVIWSSRSQQIYLIGWDTTFIILIKISNCWHKKLLQWFKISKLSLSFIEISITVFHVFLLAIRFSLLAISIAKQVFGGKGKDWLASKQWGWWQWDKSNKGSPLVTLAGSSFYPPNTIPPHYTIHVFYIWFNLLDLCASITEFISPEEL